MLYGGAYGSVSYGGRVPFSFTPPTQTTVVSGTPSVVLGTLTNTRVLTTRPTDTTLRTKNEPTALTAHPSTVILASKPEDEATLL